MRLLAIDFGTKRLGFAVGNTDLKSAVPVPMQKRTTHSGDLATIKGLIDEYDIEMVIMGYPVNMNGSKGKMAKVVENFSNYLKKHLLIPIELVDERLTSFAAEEKLRPQVKDYKKRKVILDSVSAQVMLEEYMERK